MRFCLPFHIVLALCLTLLLASCGGKKGSSGTPGQQAAIERRQFPSPPNVPSVLSDPVEIRGYVVTHFWDAFLDKYHSSDTTLVNGVPKDDVESALGRYVTLLENGCESKKAIEAVSVFFRQVNDFQSANPESNVFSFFEEMVPKYLYDPNSPVRDEDLYQPYVQGLSESAFVPEELRLPYSRDSRMCSLNKKGTPAADIVFTDRGGKRRTLYGVKAAHTLLFFSNPGCPACEDLIGKLTGSDRINGKVKSGELAVVNLYIDLEVDKWRGMSGYYPSAWINGYDQDYTIRKDLTYNVRAIPSLYVLDKDKKVVMKDAPVEKVIPYLENI